MGASRREPGPPRQRAAPRRRSRAAVLRGDPRGLEPPVPALRAGPHLGPGGGGEPRPRRPAGGARELAAGRGLLQLAERARGAAEGLRRSATAGCRRRPRSAPATACRPRPSGSGWPATPTGRPRSSTRGARRCRCRPAPATTRTRGPAASSRRCWTGYDDGYAATAPVQSMAANALGLLHLGGNVGGVGPRLLLDHALGRGPARARPGGARRRASTM